LQNACTARTIPVVGPRPGRSITDSPFDEIEYWLFIPDWIIDFSTPD